MDRGQDAIAPENAESTPTAGVVPSGQYHRTHLPHFEAGEVPQHICFRLADSLPQSLLQQWEEELRRLPEAEQQNKRHRRVDAALDQSHGACWLRHHEIAALVRAALQHFDGDRYRLHGWVIMPNHVHVLVTLLGDHSLSSVVHSWKSYTAKQANRVLEREGVFWHVDYFDRFMRDEEHLAATLDYIHWNPVKTGLCTEPSAWEWSSWNTCDHPWERGHPAIDKESETPSFPGMTSGMVNDDQPLRDGGTGATAYAEAVGVYLAFALNKIADRGSTLGRWDPTPTQSGIINAFSRQALPMTWDFAESNPLGDASGSFVGSFDLIAKVANGSLSHLHSKVGAAQQDDARSGYASTGKIVSTDPPYYDNIVYADLSDFFYVWLRRPLRPIFPDLFATLAVPKTEELVATPYRHGSKKKAETFFLDGMTQAMSRLAEQTHTAFPVTIYYAFKQSETPRERGRPVLDEGRMPSLLASLSSVSTGWETFLDAVIRAGFAITGTWPMRTELGNRMIGMGTNALASSIVLVCRRRPEDAPLATRREFVATLKDELPIALAHLQAGNIAPVDLAQAAIGPGMAVYTRFAEVLDADGEQVSVRAALALINQTLDEVLAEQEGDFDADSRWALAWFEQHGFNEGEYGIAETLSKAKNTSIAGIVDAGILESKGGKVRLLKPDELPDDWDPTTDPRLPVWEMAHHLVRVLEARGESAAAELVAQLGAKAETARELCYRLYILCERKQRATEALWYNMLVQSWPEIARLAHISAAKQSELF